MQVELSAASSAAGMVQALRRTWRVALVSRLLVLVIGCWAVAAIGYDSHRPVPPRTSENIILDLPSRWDVGWHLGLASHGPQPPSTAAASERLGRLPQGGFWLV